MTTITTLVSRFTATKDNHILTVDTDSHDVRVNLTDHPVLAAIKEIAPTVNQENSEWLRLMEIDAESAQCNIFFSVHVEHGSHLFPGVKQQSEERYYYVGRTADGVHYAVSDYNLDEVVEVRGDAELMALLDAACLVQIENFLVVPRYSADEVTFMHFPVMDDTSELLDIEGLIETTDTSCSLFNTLLVGERYSTLCLDGDKSVIVQNQKRFSTQWFL